MILITGATGLTGGELARRLSGRGVPFRALVHNPAKAKALSRLPQVEVVEGDMAAAYLTWSAVRAEDGARIEGRGAYHCRFRDGRVAEDWDVFHPMPGE